MAKGDKEENPFDSKKSPAPDTTDAPKKGPSFLSKANWTPDIVASILATNTGLLLGGIVAFLTIYGTGAALQMFSITLVFFCAWFFSITCYHMELEGHRHFQQGYLFLIPILGAFVSITLIAVVLSKVAVTKLGDIAAGMVPNSVPIPGAGDMVRNAAESSLKPVFAQFATFSDIGGMTIAITVAVVLAFSMTSAHHKMLKWYYILPALLFIGLGALIISGGAMFNAIF